VVYLRFLIDVLEIFDWCPGDIFWVSQRYLIGVLQIFVFGVLEIFAWCPGDIWNYLIGVL